ncbi:MAG TPA: 30S ribosomal protein S8 [Candidatus Nanoarchaeia archaeon]|nr:30S ribosomal protein S8 [Candidatus Nanoarchaeia archaeon]
MSHDIVADALNKIMNATRARKTKVSIAHYSKLLLSILAIAKLRGYIKHYALNQGALEVEIDKLNACNAIKPRYVVRASEIDAYVKRYLPAKDIGIIIVSTSEGLVTHHTSQEKNIGGSLLAYFY